MLQRIADSWRRFYVFLSGQTEGAHLGFVERLTASGHIQVRSPEESDYLLVFCPAVARVGANINEALDIMPAGKPAILVVMHHTFDRNHVVAESRRLVNNPNVKLTVDVLFYEGKLLDCDLNDIAWFEIKKFLQVPEQNIIPCTDERKKWIIVAVSIVAVVLFMALLIILVHEKKN